MPVKLYGLFGFVSFYIVAGGFANYSSLPEEQQSVGVLYSLLRFNL